LFVLRWCARQAVECQVGGEFITLSNQKRFQTGAFEMGAPFICLGWPHFFSHHLEATNSMIRQDSNALAEGLKRPTIRAPCRKGFGHPA